MKVFLSWSGPVSKRIALALRDWLPSVIQTVKPWMSSEDIKKGARWSPAIAKELAESRAAILCLTPDNFKEPWLNFEAGAVSNTSWSANVCTYLLSVTSSDITGPLTQFQWTVATSKEENLKLLTTINGAQEEGALDQRRLEKAFNTYWPELEDALNKISETKLPDIARRPLEDMVEETLNIVRDLQNQPARFPGYLTSPSAFALPGPESIYPLSGLMGVGAAGQVFGQDAFKVEFRKALPDTPTAVDGADAGKLYRARTAPGPTPTSQPRKSDKPREK